MSKVIRISDETFSRLQNLAEPLVDTPASVIDKLLDEYESNLKNNKTKEPNMNYKITTKRDLFLVPADKSNIKLSIQKKVKTEDAIRFLDKTEQKELRSILNGADSFNCWAMTEPNRATFEKMKKDDYALLSENGTGKFNYRGRIIGKIESHSLGNELWGYTPRKPWSLIYIFDEVKSININKQKFVQTLGYSKNDVVQKVRRVQKQNLNSALKYFGDIESMINSLNETQT